MGLEHGLCIVMKEGISVHHSPTQNLGQVASVLPKLRFPLVNWENIPTQGANLGPNKMTASLSYHPVLGTQWILTAFL